MHSPITTTAALGGERIPSRASIYIHSPLRSASGLQRLRSHNDTVVSRAEPGTVLAGGQAALSLCARGSRRARRCGALTRPANQRRGRKDAQCTEETQP
ncbi:hypothetical protein PAMA_017372 [Pampus argenteus]